MALPKAALPKYEMMIPSTGKLVQYRPFLVKEEKALMMAQQSDDQKVMINTLGDIIQACTFDAIDPKELALFDIEYIFINLRAKSVGEMSELNFNCKQCNDPKAKMSIQIDLTEIKVKENPDHKKQIDLFDDVGVTMKYPSINMATSFSSTDEIESVFDAIIDCIENVYDSDNVYAAAEQTREELQDFVSNLTQDQFKKLQAFFETMPVLEKEIEMDCPVCGYHHTQVVRGLEGFF